MPKIIIFDTTLRDGEQSPGASLTPTEKLQIALGLEKMRVDVIEAGFPIAASSEFKAVNEIAKKVKNSIVCALARAKKEDIKIAIEAIKPAKKKRIHLFLASSDIHLKYKLKITRREALKQIKEMITFAKKAVNDIEFSPEDATRSEPLFLFKVIEKAIASGAKTINIPDTVGYALPEKFGELIAEIKKNVSNIKKATISVHCHNDLGLATANSLAGIKNGASQVECTINGLGERAGNAALEEIVMALKVRRDYFQAETGIVTREIAKISKLVSHLTGIPVQPNKAIVGANAFCHEAGIHQHGILNKRETYEIMRAEDVGLRSQLVLGKHSGKHGFEDKLKKIGIRLDKKQLERAFQKFKKLADKKKNISDEELLKLL